MRVALEEAVPGLVVSGEATKGSTGAFEVVAVKTEKQYHSKLGGQGYLDNDKAKLAALVEAVKADFADVKPAEKPEAAATEPSK